jgi:hypothetical protein
MLGSPIEETLDTLCARTDRRALVEEWPHRSAMRRWQRSEIAAVLQGHARAGARAGLLSGFSA